MSGVADFRYAFTVHRNEAGGAWVTDGNLKAATFTENLAKWNTAKVVDTEQMFRDAVAFNSEIGAWDVSSLQKTWSMFYQSSSFNGNIGGWKTTSLENVITMFRGAQKFEGNGLDGWDVSKIKSFQQVHDQIEIPE